MSTDGTDDIRDEYDFSGGVRGKYLASYRSIDTAEMAEIEDEKLWQQQFAASQEVLAELAGEARELRKAEAARDKPPAGHPVSRSRK
ncbi:MAG: hypothetical protein SF066_10410 [Thermoanaerobaculia bacterium]|nr:hypothetical protein [Thermoanaerobaculia bacterium]